MGIDPSNLPEQINDEPIDKDSYLVRDLPCYQIASIDTKELLEHTNNCLFYKGSRIAAQKQGSGKYVLYIKSSFKKRCKSTKQIYKF